MALPGLRAGFALNNSNLAISTNRHGWTTAIERNGLDFQLIKNIEVGSSRLNRVRPEPLVSSRVNAEFALTLTVIGRCGPLLSVNGPTMSS